MSPRRPALKLVNKAYKGFDPLTFLSQRGRGRRISRYRKNEIVFSQGTPANAIFYIQKGRVKLAVVSARGKEAVAAILDVGDFFGEGCLAGQSVRVATARAFTDCSIMRVEKSTMTRILHEQPAFSELFIAHLLCRNIRAEEDLIDQLVNSSERRLARVLLLLANFGQERPPEPIIPRITQETLAEMVGTTRSRVNFFLNKFRKLGFIDYGAGIHVHGALLNVILGDDGCGEKRRPPLLTD
ncbi:MAG: Crp/Fnr family transcriptional regulator [Candidatus Eremiobacteraeota bacterium]|nr:Crp/Fnr family transcriptional regulator [Candidatus Eremiobacteraeota bacterium]